MLRILEDSLRKYMVAKVAFLKIYISSRKKLEAEIFKIYFTFMEKHLRSLKSIFWTNFSRISMAFFFQGYKASIHCKQFGPILNLNDKELNIKIIVSSKHEHHTSHGPVFV